MKTIGPSARLTDELVVLRQDLHAHPEIAFEEVRTGDVVSRFLEDCGIAVHRGLGKTGVVGTLSRGESKRAIALRADMDALPMDEANEFGHRSKYSGKMHACGHDGHTAMLLGAARMLAESREFDGTVHFIFQPAEENEGGGRAMVEDGLFEKFPCDAVFGLHNIPGIPVGEFAVMPGPMMASFDIFDVKIVGQGTAASFPHVGRDPILAATALVQALQSIVSRNVPPIDAAVVSVTQINAGTTWNVIPAVATLKGTTRVFKPEVRDLVEDALRRISAGVAATYGTTAEVLYERRYPPTVNTPKEAAFAASVLESMKGATRVRRDAEPIMAAEDFAFMLQKKSGCYVWIGNGLGSEGGCMAHNPHYDFNDEIIPLGVRYWVSLAERWLQSF